MIKHISSVRSNGWRGPVLRLTTAENNRSNRYYELELQYISCETDRKTNCECKWEVYKDSKLWSIQLQNM